MTQRNDADAIENDIVETQNQISDTVSQLQDKLQPQQLMRDVVGDPQQVPSQVFEAVKRNPLAAGLIAVGALWLVSGKQAKMPRFKSSKAEGPSLDQQLASVVRYEGEGDDIYRKRLDAARSEYSAPEWETGNEGQSMGQRLRSATRKLRDKAGSGSLAASAKERGRKTRDWSIAKHEQEPLVTGVAAMAAGALAGLSIPKTEIEREKLAPLHDAAMTKAGALKEKALQAAGDKLGGTTKTQAQLAGA